MTSPTIKTRLFDGTCSVPHSRSADRGDVAAEAARRARAGQTRWTMSNAPASAKYNVVAPTQANSATARTDYMYTVAIQRVQMKNAPHRRNQFRRFLLDGRRPVAMSELRLQERLVRGGESLADQPAKLSIPARIAHLVEE